MLDQELIGRHIKEFRRKNGMTQKEFGKLVYVSDKTVSRWEQGKGLPDISALPEIARVLGISLNELVGEETPPEIDSVEFLQKEGTMPATNASEDKEKKRRKVFILRTVAVFLTLLFAAGVIAPVLFYLYISDETYRNVYVFEAEDAVFTDAFRVEEVDGASGGAVAAWLHTPGEKISFRLDCAKPATVQMKIALNCAVPYNFEDKMTLEVNGAAALVGTVPGKGWDGESDTYYYTLGTTREIDVNLKKGRNEIVITVRDGEGLNLDCLYIDSGAKLTILNRTYRFEAENADITGLYSVYDSDRASSGKYVGDLRKYDAESVTPTALTFRLYSEESMYIKMLIYINHPYTIDFHVKFICTVNGEEVYVGGGEGSGVSSEEDRRESFDKPYFAGISLKKGENEIVFEAVYGENFDCISFYTAVLLL